MKTLVTTILGICMLFLVAGNIVAGETKDSIFAVVKAQYGAGEKWVDVTDKVTNAVKDGTLTMVASNGNFGDPIEGIAKSLKVIVNYNGVELTFTADENVTLTIDRIALDVAVTAAREAAEKAAK